jgi:K+-sensing histidine kinase KdpD
MFKRDQKQIHRFWRSAAKCLLGVIVQALLTYVCFRLQVNPTTVALLYLIVIVLVSLTSDFMPAAIVSIVAYVCLDSFFNAPLFQLEIIVSM